MLNNYNFMSTLSLPYKLKPLFSLRILRAFKDLL